MQQEINMMQALWQELRVDTDGICVVPSDFHQAVLENPWRSEGRCVSLLEESTEGRLTRSMLPLLEPDCELICPYHTVVFLVHMHGRYSALCITLDHQYEPRRRLRMVFWDCAGPLKAALRGIGADTFARRLLKAGYLLREPDLGLPIDITCHVADLEDSPNSSALCTYRVARLMRHRPVPTSCRVLHYVPTQECVLYCETPAIFSQRMTYGSEFLLFWTPGLPTTWYYRPDCRALHCYFWFMPSEHIRFAGMDAITMAAVCKQQQISFHMHPMLYDSGVPSFQPLVDYLLIGYDRVLPPSTLEATHLLLHRRVRPQLLACLVMPPTAPPPPVLEPRFHGVQHYTWLLRSTQVSALSHFSLCVRDFDALWRQHAIGTWCARNDTAWMQCGVTHVSHPRMTPEHHLVLECLLHPRSVGRCAERFEQRCVELAYQPEEEEVVEEGAVGGSVAGTVPIVSGHVMTAFLAWLMDV